MNNAITGSLERVNRKAQLAIGRGRITTVNDGGNVQMLQVQLGINDFRDTTPRLAEYGYTSNPPAGSDALLVFIAGDRSNGAVIATGHQASRMKGLLPGEVAIFDNLGQSVYLTRAGIIVNGAGNPLTINNTPVVTVNASTKVALNTPELDVSGSIKSGGAISAAQDITDNTSGSGKSMATMRQDYDIHDHLVTGVQTGAASVTTNPPNVQE